MKIGIFTDCHYSSAQLTCGNRRNSRSLEKIQRTADALSRCDLVICLGDLIDCDETREKTIENLKCVSSIIRSIPAPFICVLGNHDLYAFEKDQFKLITGFTLAPYTIQKEGKTLIFLDACFQSNGKPYSPYGNWDWTDAGLTDISLLGQELECAQEPVYIFLHQNIDPNVEKRHIIRHADRIRALLEKSGKVKAVIQGHYHEGMESVINGIPYITLPAMCTLEEGYYRILDI
jgi:alkaline phosphatase